MNQESSPSNLSAEIFTELKNRIIHWEYLPDQRLTEIALSEEFGVSRSPIREVLQMLEEKGLVVKVPRLGYTVRQPDLTEIYELYEFRLALELYIVTYLAKQGMPEKTWQHLYDHWQACFAASPHIAADISIQDEQFHEDLAQALGNSILTQQLKEVNERLHFIRMNDITTSERLVLTCKQHLEILTAIKEHNVEKARNALSENIDSGRLHVDQAIKEALSKAYFKS